MSGGRKSARLMRKVLGKVAGVAGLLGGLLIDRSGFCMCLSGGLPGCGGFGRIELLWVDGLKDFNGLVLYFLN